MRRQHWPIRTAARRRRAPLTGSITWALESDPANLIPFGGVSTSNMWGKEFMYDSLLEWDQDLQIQPALAESYEVDADATSYTFKLRQGVLFHNGQEMTANDVKYSFDTAPKPPPPGIEVAFLANIASVEVVDDYTVTITMSKPDPTLPGVMAWARYTPIVPAGHRRPDQLCSARGSAPGRTGWSSSCRTTASSTPAMRTTGSRAFPASRTSRSRCCPTSSPGSPRCARARSTAAPLTADVARTLENDESLQILEGLFAAPRVIQFNTVEDVPWRDVRVRQAINLAIDRQEIIDNVYGGERRADRRHLARLRRMAALRRTNCRSSTRPTSSRHRR